MFWGDGFYHTKWNPYHTSKNGFITTFFAISPRRRPQPAPEPADSGRPQLAWTGTSLGPVYVGPYRLSNGLCRCLNSTSTGTDH